MTPMPTDAPSPQASDLCADDAISIANILALVRTPLIGPKEHQASGWFGQTDFALCQRHVDAEGEVWSGGQVQTVIQGTIIW